MCVITCVYTEVGLVPGEVGICYPPPKLLWHGRTISQIVPPVCFNKKSQ